MISFIRTMVMYILVILSMRCMGKRQIGQLQPYEIVVALMIADVASLPMEDNSVPLLSGIIPILSLVLAQIVMSYVVMRSGKFRTFISGKSRIVIRQGRIDEKALQDEMYTVDDLVEALRIQGYTNIAEISQARLETNGELSVVPFGDYAPLTRSDLGVKADEDLCVDVIICGALIEDNISALKVDSQKLYEAVKNAGGKSVKDVLYANVSLAGEFFIQLKRGISK